MSTKKVAALQYVPDAPANSALIGNMLPTDEYGLCSDLRKCMVRLASRLHGNPKKLKAVEDNLAVLIGHLYAKFNEQCAANTAAEHRDKEA